MLTKLMIQVTSTRYMCDNSCVVGESRLILLELEKNHELGYNFDARLQISSRLLLRLRHWRACTTHRSSRFPAQGSYVYGIASVM